MKVKFKHRSGRVEFMDVKFATVLHKLKRGTVVTDDPTKEENQEEPKKRGRPAKNKD